MAFGMKKAGGGGGLNLAKAAMASKLVRFFYKIIKKTIYICTNFPFFSILLYIKHKSYIL